DKLHPIIALGVSKTENPLDGWWLYYFDAVAHWGMGNDGVYQAGDAIDYPLLGIDPVTVSFTNKVANAVSKNYRYWRLAFAQADPMSQGSGNVKGIQY